MCCVCSLACWILNCFGILVINILYSYAFLLKAFSTPKKLYLSAYTYGSLCCQMFVVILQCCFDQFCHDIVAMKHPNVIKTISAIRFPKSYHFVTIIHVNKVVLKLTWSVMYINNNYSFCSTDTAC